MQTTMDIDQAAHFEYVLRLADSALILGQRLSEWCGHGPVLEEDIALANVALDLIGQARLLLTHAGAIEGKGRDEDALAFLRTESEFRNVTLVELPNGDFGRTVLRGLLFTTLQRELWRALTASANAELAAIAHKCRKETEYHVRHFAEWTVRLGDGTEESHGRMQGALGDLWPYTNEFFADSFIDNAIKRSNLGPAWSELKLPWERMVAEVLNEATLQVPQRTAFLSAGKDGRHSEHMGHLLTEMQYLQRTYPGATW